MPLVPEVPRGCHTYATSCILAEHYLKSQFFINRDRKIFLSFRVLSTAVKCFYVEAFTICIKFFSPLKVSTTQLKVFVPCIICFTLLLYV